MSDVHAMRHSCAHLLAAAVQQLYPDAKFGVGPTTVNGFYYDILVEGSISSSDLAKIETTMRQMRNKDLEYTRFELGVDEAIEEMAKRNQAFKVELLDLLKTRGSTAVARETGDDDAVAVGTNEAGVEQVSFYQVGDFVDLCRGPHVSKAGEIGAFKLTHVAGAYWRGNEKNPMLQRVYGLCFETKEELEHEVWRAEQARLRDHRKLGKELNLFAFSPDVGPGLPLWLPRGTVIRDELEALARQEERRDGYQRVVTPVITRENLYYRSGHLPYYAEDMYAPIDIEGDRFYLRPMNCPHHHQVYLSRPRSYRELPLRLAEYGDCYRFEPSGTLSGLMRVRGFAQNDAHIYCSREQAKDEFVRVMHLHTRLYEIFGIEEYYMRLSLPDLSKLEKYVDEPDEWLAALDVIREAMAETGYDFVEAVGEAAFYGPKVDFMIRSAIGTEYAISTNQLDFLASKRFGLVYNGSDGSEHPVYVIHRAPLGSHERFVAFLIEHYAAAFPTWLSPVQARLIPIGDRHIPYAERVMQELLDAEVPTATSGLRVDIDVSDERMSKKVRQGQLEKIPYMLVVGDNEEAEGRVAVRHRSGAQLGAMTVDELLDRLRREVRERRDTPAPEPAVKAAPADS